ncbi:MAG: SUMF1/EgtB/PvdO family nonheme iron enzyme [Planctomycetota bacterium]
MAEHEERDHSGAGSGEEGPAGLPAGHDVGQRIGPYHLLQRIGRGGMGTVYLAEQREPVRRRVAVKVMNPGMDSKAFLARFDAERQALSMMEHNSIARVLDAGATQDGQPYLAMEYVKGIPITDYCDQHKLALEQRVELFRSVCSGVQHAHQKGVMHRDLKPSNVLVTVQDGMPTVKIIDFGLAKAVDHRLVQETLFTEAGQILGTPEYMSPEQAGLGGLDIDTRTDVYSLGVLLYELLTGSLPITREELLRNGWMEMQRLIREGEPKKPSTRITQLGAAAEAFARARKMPPAELERRLRGDLDWIVMKAIEKDRAERYQTAQELAADLLRHLQDEPVTAGPPSAGYLLKKLLRRYRAQVAAAAAIVLALGIGLSVAVVQWREASRQEEIATTALRRYRQLEDLGRLRRFEAEADELQEGSQHARELDDWIDRVDRWLAAMPDHHQTLTEMRTRAQRDGDGWRFDDGAHQLLHDALADLADGLEALQAPGGVLSQARDSLAWSREVRRVTLGNQHEAWQQTIDAVGSDRRFAGLHLEPQEGLVPLGADPGSGLPEFWMPRSGARPTRDPESGEWHITGATGIVFVLLPPGRVQLGSQETNAAGVPNALNELNGPTVSLNAFFLGKYEVTQGQWMRLAHGDNPSRYPSSPQGQPYLDRPVEQITWNDAVAALTRHGLLLPTEPQWEYACRAGTTTEWWFGDRSADGGRGCLLLPKEADDRSAWDYCRFNAADGFGSRKQSGAFHPNAEDWPRLDDTYPVHAPVGSFEPNAFGLHDVHGNVYELTRGAYGNYDAVQVRPGDGLILGGDPDEIVIRGGSWAHKVDEARSAARKAIGKQQPYHSVGLRVARALD